MRFTAEQSILRTLFPAALCLAFGAEAVHAQGRCGRQTGSSSMQAQYGQQARLYAMRQQAAYQQYAQQQYALQQYALQNQLYALRQQAVLGQMSALSSAEALQLQLLQQAVLQQAYGQVPAQQQAVPAQRAGLGRQRAAPVLDVP